MGADPSDHRPSIASPAPDPEESSSALLQHQGERQTDHVAVELDRAVKVADRKVGFE